jgi:hypothetical protein
MIPNFDIFSVGKRYRVKCSFVKGIYTFNAGEILIFKSWGFIPYDSSYGYQFHSESDPAMARDKAWTLHHSKEPETWRDFFERVD